MNWTEDDHPTPEQERETWAREECQRRGIDPDEICADGGVEAWQVVDQERLEGRLKPALLSETKLDLLILDLGIGAVELKGGE